ncbi:hypothetical protein V8E51_019032 [Hyaloscypha variabilis]
MSSQHFQSLKSSTHKRHSSNRSLTGKHSKPSKFNGSSASKSQPVSGNEYSREQHPTSSFNNDLVQLDSNTHPYVPISTKGQQTSFNQRYSIEVISGCTSLGIEVPTSMHQALVDQHGYFTPGEFSYSTVMLDSEYAIDSQQVFHDVETAEPLFENGVLDYGYTWRKDGFQRDLAGVGTQFEGLKRV